MSLRTRLAATINAEPHELPGLLAAFATVFAMFSSYSILRPIRETMGLTSGVETLPALFWGTFIAMLAAQPLYGWLTSRFRRSTFLPWIYLFFIVNILGFYAWFNVQDDHTWIARVYFIWVSVFNLFVVAVFWSLMADVFTREQAGRLFGFIAAGLEPGRPVRAVPRQAARAADRHDQPAACFGSPARARSRKHDGGAAPGIARTVNGRRQQTIATRGLAAVRWRRSRR